VTPLILAAVVSMCPAYQTGDTYPFMILRDCPAPVAGLLYPLDHVSVDREKSEALTDCAASAEACAVTIDKMPEPPSRIVWLVAGVLSGALAVYIVEVSR